MRRLGSVQQKIPCVFVTEVRDEPSRKRESQHFQVLATEHLNPKALGSDVESAIPTEKLDGTCCYVSIYKGEPYLWARFDRKPNKQADKRFKKFQHSEKGSTEFTWNVEEDFKRVPDSWIPAHGVEHCNEQPRPDGNGHIPGWVPVERYNKQYCWHSSVVNYETGVGLVLRTSPDDEEVLEITAVPLSELLEETLELIGTNVNANPYGLGCKKQPIHLLVPHGSLKIRSAPYVNYQQLFGWFQRCEEGKVEGIVWHCNDGTLIKLHRHHLGLKWPLEETFLNSRPVVIHVDLTRYGWEMAQDLFTAFSRLNGQKFDHIQDIKFDV
ncbi:RNA ligase 1 [Amia ocellicauda]|uniref:RNA ligase 1 n=1 Tax=Amia ocellicauda TaxID=2972642 RepID=UPI003463AB5B